MGTWLVSVCVCACTAHRFFTNLSTKAQAHTHRPSQHGCDRDSENYTITELNE